MPVLASSQKRTYVNRYARKARSRRRVSATKRFAWAKPSASRNKRMAYSNRRKINKIAHQVGQTRIYADYLNSGSVNAITGWWGAKLCAFNSWGTTLRISENISTSKKVRWDNFSLYFGAYLNQGSKPVAVNVFIVTPSREYAHRDFSIALPAIYTEYSASGDSQCVRLNRDVFRVLSQKQFTLSNVNLMQGAADLTNNSIAGNPNSTWARWSTRIKVGFDINKAIGSMIDEIYTPEPWYMKSQLELPYYQRMYMLVYVGGSGSSQGVQLYWDHQMTVSKVD